MANYPIKLLKDESNTPFVPLVSTDCIRDKDNQTLQQILNKKLSPENLLPGDYVNITTKGDDCYVNVDLPASLLLIDNLDTEEANQGGLDARQGKILKDMIPEVVNDVSSTSTTKALSANQGYVLNSKFNDYVQSSELSSLVKAIILASKPVGSIEINITGANPSTYLGGTWVAWGSGKVPVGVDSSDTDFSTVEKTGGSKTHTHGYSHTHGVPGVSHSHGSGDLYANIGSPAGNAGALGFTATGWHGNNSTYSVGGNTSQAGGHPGRSHDTPVGGSTGSTTPGSTTTNSQSTTTTDGSSNVQPYITCYMWKRTK